MKIYESASDQPLVDWQWYEPSLRNITQLVLKRVPRAGGRALDVGCGTGRLTFALAKRGYDVLGIDPNERVIELARQIGQKQGPAVRFEVADVGTPGVVEPGTYDVVVCSEVLEHVEDYRPIIEGMYAALRPGGRLVISVPCDPAKWSVLDEYGGHVRRFTRKQIEGDLAAFRDVEVFVTGFPFYRLLVRAYLAKIRLLGQQHSNEALWQSRSTHLIAAVMYPFARLDNLFAFTGLGDQMIVAARK